MKFEKLIPSIVLAMGFFWSSTSFASDCGCLKGGGVPDVKQSSGKHGVGIHDKYKDREHYFKQAKNNCNWNLSDVEEKIFNTQNRLDTLKKSEADQAPALRQQLAFLEQQEKELYSDMGIYNTAAAVCDQARGKANNKPMSDRDKDIVAKCDQAWTSYTTTCTPPPPPSSTP